MEAPQPAHVALFCTQGMGHLIPLIELARKLVHLQSSKFTVTFIIPNDGSPMKAQRQLLQSLHPSINSILLPHVRIDDLPEDASIETRIILGVIRSVPALRQVLSESPRVSAFVVDLFGSVTLDLAKELGIPLYVFFPSSAMGLTLCLQLPQLDESCSCEFKDLPEPITLPGCIPVHGSCLPEPFQDRKSETYKRILEMCKKYSVADGVLVNSFSDLEADTFEALQNGTGRGSTPPVYPVGPLTRTGSSVDKYTEKPACLKWLDEQPPDSVLYVSFGSGGTLSTEQLMELAKGLEISEQRFLLVVKNPHDTARNAAYFDVIDQDKMESIFEYLFKGFIERTKGKGFVLSQWAPQVEVLSHKAVGGFVTHCGWNSILESIVHGVPLIAWPLYAEQKMNSVLLGEGLRIALRVTENENGVVESEQIAKLARTLIEGEEGKEIRVKMRNMKDAAARALRPDGSSSKALAEVAEKWVTTG